VCVFVAESEPGSDSGGLRQDRNVRADRESGARVQRDGNRTEALVRHVGVSATADRAVAHTERAG